MLMRTKNSPWSISWIPCSHYIPMHLQKFVTPRLLRGTWNMNGLTLSMLRLLSSKAQGRNDFWKTSKPCHVGIHWIALAEYSQMSNHVPGFQSFSGFLHHFVLSKLATTSIKVNPFTPEVYTRSDTHGHTLITKLYLEKYFAESFSSW